MGPLGCLLALQLLLPMTSPAEAPPPPAISVTPEKREYLIGDTVLIRCDAPAGPRRVQGFQFLGSSGWAVEVRTSSSSYTLPVNLTDPRDGGAHTCAYSLRSRQPLRSQESSAIVISVRERPPRPSLALGPPGGLALEGQPLLLSCRAPPGTAPRRFRFYKDDRELVGGAGVAVTSGDGQARLEVAAARGAAHTGNFSCGYEEQQQGRWVASRPSPARRLRVAEVAPPPLLTVDPPGGRVVPGQPLLLTCLAPRGDFRPRFRFFRNGQELLPPGQPPAGPAEPRGEPPGPSEPPKPPVEPPAPPVGPSDPSPAPPVGPSDPSPAPPVGPSDPPPDPPAAAAGGPGGPRGRFLLPSSPPGFGGTFSCRVEEQVGGARVVSAPSAAVEVTMEAPFPLTPVVAGGAAGGVAAVLGLLLAVWWRRRRRSGDWKGLHNKEDPGALPMVPVT